MSHEGIRFVTAEEARHHDQQHRELPREAVEPAKVRVHKTEGTGMEIEWKDGHFSAWNFAWLRLACPCATCHEEREHTGRRPGEPKPKAAALLPMYEPPPRPTTVTPVGRYAISFHWNDGHTSGIYSWDFLRRHCTCLECRGENTTGPQEKS
jgi:DUF971 family protein